MASGEAGLLRPQVAVLVPTYNGIPWLSEQFATITAQQAVDVHFFVADDGSTDATVTLIKSFAEQHPRVTLLSGERLGTAARNYARILAEIPIERMDYVAFADQDDIWGPRKLARAIEELSRTGAACYASNMIAFVDGAGTELEVKKDHPQRRFDYLFQSASAACTYVLRSDAAKIVADAVGDSYQSWPQRTSLDCVIYAATRSRGLRWIIDGESHIRYRQHARNVFGANHGWAAAQKRLKMLRSGWVRGNLADVMKHCGGAAGIAEIANRVSRGSWMDRVWLAARAGEFRRERSARWVLRACFLIDWF